MGETGLDSDRMFSPWDAQLDNLRRNLALALATGKPAILHCRSKAGERDAQDALLEELRRAGFDGEAARAAFGDRPPALIHSFSGPLDYARDVLAMGLAISFSGLVFRSGEEASAEVAAIVPSDRLLVETDAPFLTPRGAPRSRNEPAFVALTARWAAERRGVGEDGLDAFGDALVAALRRDVPTLGRARIPVDSGGRRGLDWHSNGESANPFWPRPGDRLPGRHPGEAGGTRSRGPKHALDHLYTGPSGAARPAGSIHTTGH